MSIRNGEAAEHLLLGQQAQLTRMIRWRLPGGRRYPDCRFPQAATATVADAIRDHQQRRQPFSLIRVGDAEGALLAWDRSARPMDLDYLADWFGDAAYDPRFVRRMQNRLRAALQATDWLGIREDMLGVPLGAVGSFRRTSSKLSLSS